LQEAQAEQRVAPAACGAHLHRMQSAPTGSARASSSVNGSRRSRFANAACRLGLSRAELTWRRVRATRIGTARGLNFKGTAARWLERRGAARLGSARLGSARRSARLSQSSSQDRFEPATQLLASSAAQQVSRRWPGQLAGECAVSATFAPLKERAPPGRLTHKAGPLQWPLSLLSMLLWSLLLALSPLLLPCELCALSSPARLNGPQWCAICARNATRLATCDAMREQPEAGAPRAGLTSAESATESWR